MKNVFAFLIAFLTVLSVQAQPIAGKLTLSVSGNKNLEIAVDDRIIGLDNSNTIGNKTTVSINDLVNGQHSLLVKRTDPNINRTVQISTVFILRNRYDMMIGVNEDGSLELIETRQGGIADEQAPMSNVNFATLLRNVKNQRSSTARTTLINNAFATTNNYFTTYQVRQLLQQVNSENERLQLAKSSYPKITDPGNFYTLYDLLKSQASRDEIADFVNGYYEETEVHMAMSDANFNILYQDIRNQWPANTQVNSLTNAFNNTSNYFTSYQASRLIQLVTGDNNRLPLAKLSYRTITDRNNFNQVVNLLSSQYNRDELTAYVNSYGDSGTTGVAMTDANFNTLYQDIRNQWPASTQQISLTNAFNNTSNYFTSYQASRLIQLVTGDNSRLPLAKLSYRTITDRNNFNQVINLLSSQYNRDELTAYVNSYGDSGTTGVAMTDANFNTLYQDIRNQWPASTQLISLTNAFNNTSNYFTSYQASRLIQLVTGDNNRLPLAKLSFRTITDRNNFTQVVNLLSSQNNRDELTAYVNSNSSGTTTRVAMSDADFNTLYQNIQMQFMPFAKMSALTNAFSNTGYFFSTAQAKLLIPMVSLESNRLQLAKLSYRSITDRNNFSQVYELLDNQADRDELDAYVKAYTE